MIRNKELWQEYGICLLGAFAMGMLSRQMAVALATCACILLANGLFHRKRYHRIAAMSEKIDKILHGDLDLSFKDESEGELSILQNEVAKMTLRLKEQNGLLAQDKIRLKDLIADIFHQMRTPLTSMELTVSLLKQENLDYGQRISLTHDLQRQMKRMHWLAESLLKMSKLDADVVVFHRRKTTVEEIVEGALFPFLVPMELKSIEVERKMSGETLEVDPSWTIEAFANLFKNALEHAPKGGRIVVSASDTPLYTEVTVTDNGEGFDEKELPHLFERFYKGKNASQDSVGIGLSLCRTIIASQNGTIKASNSKNGAMFTVRFYRSMA